MDTFHNDYETYAQEQHPEQMLQASAGIEQVIDELTQAIHILNDSKTDKNSFLESLSFRLKSKITCMQDVLRQSAQELNKLCKLVEKKFGNHEDWNPENLSGKEKALSSAIAQHFLREGNMEIAKRFHEVNKLDEVLQHHKFEQMYDIVAHLRVKRLDSIFAWVSQFRPQLQELDPLFEFDLHKITYLEILKSQHLNVSQKATKAIEYAQKHFINTHEVEKLICALVYLGRPSSNPYQMYFDPLTLDSYWTNIESRFTRVFCSILGMSPESPLFIASMVGVHALPRIMGMTTIMKNKNNWTSAPELLVEIPLLPSQRYHSVFACPVSRVQGSEENPPMMMPCGHTICSESLNRLSRSPTTRFKCPYCPSESLCTQALRVYL